MSRNPSGPTMRRFLGVLLLTLSAAGRAAGQARSPVEAVADSVWARAAATTTIPGAIVVVVGPDGPLLVKGYGVRDIRTREPIDPERTLFQIGSTTKLFTAILALQAVDEGKLTLDQDLRGLYPDLRFKDRYDAPVTLRQMLTHRAGFDSDVSGFMTEDSAAARRFDPDYVTPHLRRVRLPGFVPSYDNVAVGIAGEIAARSFGLSYVDAVQTRIMRPLGMDRSGIGLYDGRAGFAAACHRTEADGHVTICPRTYMRRGFEGAGEAVVTGADMARFMTALLHGGRTPSGGALLRPETFAAFTNPDQNRFAAGVPGIGWILLENEIAGHRALAHGGGYDGFSTLTHLLPQSGWGVFVVTEQYAGLPRTQSFGYSYDQIRRATANQKNGGMPVNVAFTTALLKLAPADSPRTTPAASGPALPPEAVAGLYTSAGAESFSRLAVLSAPLVGTTITVDGPKAISIAGKPYDWAGGSLYRSRADGAPSVFKATPAGMVWAVNSHLASVRVDGLHGRGSVILLLTSLIVLTLLALVGSLFAKGEVKRACRLGLLTGLGGIVFLALEFQVYPELHFSGGRGAWIIAAWRLLFDLALLAGLVSAWRAGRAVLSPAGQRPGWFSAGVGTLTAATAVLFVVMATVWNLWRIID